MTDPFSTPLPIAPEGARAGLLRGALAGVVAAAVGAAAWAAITAVTGIQIGFMALGVGALIGWAIRYIGKGSGIAFQVTGGLLAGLGCVLGNLLAACTLLADQVQVSVLRVLQTLDPQLALDLMASTFAPVDLLFYGLGVWEGWKLSVHQPEVETLDSSGSSDPPQATDISLP